MTRTVKKSLVAFICCALFVLGIGAFFYYFKSQPNTSSTYFTYNTSEVKPLSQLNSDQMITTNSLPKWDEMVFELVKENKLGDAYAARIYAYLYLAQRDATFLSEKIKHKPMGSLDPISSKILCLFFPPNCLDLVKYNYSDAYSEALAKIVLEKIKPRMLADNYNAKPYPEKISSHNWAGVRPYFAQEVGSWMPWFMKQGSQFRAPPPPAYDSIEWQKQLSLTKAALANITPEQTKSVIFWAGNPGTVTPAGIWLMLANDYMWSQHLSLNNILLIRSVLAMGIEDSLIAVFDSKYTYWVKRPNMLDPSILTVMPTPNHPSYPAGHSTVSSAASTILDFYLPNNKTHWDKAASDASMGRVWGGIHFPIDAEQGFILGHKVGEAAVQAASSKYYE